MSEPSEDPLLKSARREMLAAFAELYPAFETWMRNAGAGDFEQEVSSGDAT